MAIRFPGSGPGCQSSDLDPSDHPALRGPRPRVVTDTPDLAEDEPRQRISPCLIACTLAQPAPERAGAAVHSGARYLLPEPSDRSGRRRSGPSPARPLPNFGPTPGLARRNCGSRPSSRHRSGPTLISISNRAGQRCGREPTAARDSDCRSTLARVGCGTAARSRQRCLRVKALVGVKQVTIDTPLGSEGLARPGQVRAAGRFLAA